MKVMLIHNRYIKEGGEDIVFNLEKSLLESRGIYTSEFIVSNKEININSVANSLLIGLNTVWSFKNYNRLKHEIKRIKPDIIHVHNTFPLLSPSIYWAINKLGIPIVQTLHNYRFVCANALLLRNDKPCENCVAYNLWPALRYRCYRGSFLATLPVAGMIELHRFLGTYTQKVDAYIALTQFAKSIFVKAGLPQNKIFVKPNFIFDHTYSFSRPMVQKNQVVFVGRISPEKGLDILLEAWSKLRGNTTKLAIIGDGPEKNYLQQKYSHLTNVEWRGWLNREQVLNEMATSHVVVIPSKWYEGFPMIVVESYAVGTPVIAPMHAAFPEIIREGLNGWLFKPGCSDSLYNILEKISSLNSIHREFLNKKARETYLENYSAEKNYEMLINIYNKVLCGKSRS